MLLISFKDKFKKKCCIGIYPLVKLSCIKINFLILIVSKILIMVKFS